MLYSIFYIRTDEWRDQIRRRAPKEQGRLGLSFVTNPVTTNTKIIIGRMNDFNLKRG